MLPKWLKRSSLGLSVVLAAITWFALTGVWLHSAKGGFIDKAVSALYQPAFKAGTYIGALIFPNYSIRGTTGWYLMPLFGAAGEFVLLIVIWYLFIRLKRTFRPEQPDVLATPEHYESSKARRKRRDEHFDGAHEPEYIPKQHPYWPGRISGLLDAIDYEQFTMRTWRDFRDHTGSWPLLSICFHYATLLGGIFGTIVFLWLRDERQWGDGRSFAIGISLGISFLVLIVVGGKVMRKLDWRLFGNSRQPESDGR